MRNTPEALRFVDTATTQGVGAAIAERDGPFGDYSQAPASEQPKRDHVIEAGGNRAKRT
jgi:enoyl-CoA hydratase